MDSIMLRSLNVQINVLCKTNVNLNELLYIRDYLSEVVYPSLLSGDLEV